MYAVHVEELEKRFGPVFALRAVSAHVVAGERVLLAGPNGAGKSTLLRILAGLTRPSRGRVEVLGADPFRSAGAAVRGRIGFLGADAALYGDLSVEENLEFCARLHGRPASCIDAALAMLGLEEVRSRPAGALSLGYRRRAGLARAWLLEPELLLLDEPWNGLDGAAAERLDAALEKARAGGVTVLIAAHAVDGRPLDFDRTWQLENGRLRGSPSREGSSIGVTP